MSTFKCVPCGLLLQKKHLTMILWKPGYLCLCPCCPLAQQWEHEDHKGEGRTGLSSPQQKMCAPLSGNCL